MEKIASALPTPEVTVNFGHASDWAPKQVVLAASAFNAEEIGSLLQLYRSGVNGIEEGPRGLVVWLATQSEDERTQIRQTAQGVLDEFWQHLTIPCR